jgi:N-acetylglucosamine-6-phosphate deacetylase
VRCELIADNVHVHPAAIKILAEVKGPLGLILITDAVRAAGLPEGEHQLDQRAVTVRAGAVRLRDGTLAGSVLTMERALANLLAATGWPLSVAWPASSLNAARTVGLAASKGSLEVGKDADMVLLAASGDVALTVVGGEVVYQAEAVSPQVPPAAAPR